MVNRQLQIANAFEEKIKSSFPGFHKWLRANYDKYGFEFSKHIQSDKK